MEYRQKGVFIKIIDAFEAVTSLEPEMQAADLEPVEPSSGFHADPEPAAPNFADDAAYPESLSSDMLWPDDYDDAQVLTFIRMWSGFEPECLTDAQLIDLLGLENHLGADIPDWIMTELGALVVKGDVAIEKFMTTLEYVLENARRGD